MSDKIHVVIADDHTLFRDGLAGIIGGTEDFEVVGQAGNMQEAVQLARDLLPDIILLDIDMPGGGLEAARIIASELPVTRIVILTSSEDDDHLIGALKIGARAYILKGVAARELIRILRTVWAGESYVPPILAASLLLEMREARLQQKHATSPLDELTPREREILEGLAAGLSNKEIGEQLFLSEKTVKHYMTNILQKLQVRNRVEAALLAQKEMKKP
jgi:two-component system, NarL family, nitrate/nitrite response regulator NarL